MGMGLLGTWSWRQRPGQAEKCGSQSEIWCGDERGGEVKAYARRKGSLRGRAEI